MVELTFPQVVLLPAGLSGLGGGREGRGGGEGGGGRGSCWG